MDVRLKVLEKLALLTLFGEAVYQVIKDNDNDDEGREEAEERTPVGPSQEVVKEVVLSGVVNSLDLDNIADVDKQH